MKANASEIVVFCDFDGTVTQRDSCDEFFRHFGEFDIHHAELSAGRINVAEYYRRVCASLPDDLSDVAVGQFAEKCEVDAYFGEFIRYCRSQSYPLTIVSDGFDRYIYPILRRIGEKVEVKCNILNNSLPIFPGASESCQCFCASCKRNVLLSASNDAIIIYIGDGLSDTCAAEYADIVFAKGVLAAYCNQHKIPHHPFRTFADVLYILRKRIENGDIRRRRQAELKRLAAFEAE